MIGDWYPEHIEKLRQLNTKRKNNPNTRTRKILTKRKKNTSIQQICGENLPSFTMKNANKNYIETLLPQSIINNILKKYAGKTMRKGESLHTTCVYGH